VWLVFAVPWVGYFGWLGVTNYVSAASASASEHEYLTIVWDADLEVPDGFLADEAEQQRLQRVSRIATKTGLPGGLVSNNLDEVETEIEFHIQELCSSSPTDAVELLCKVRAFEAVFAMIGKEAFQKRSRVLPRWLANHPYNKDPDRQPLSIQRIESHAKDARDSWRSWSRASREHQSNVDIAITYGFALPVFLLLLFPLCSYVLVPFGAFIMDGFRPDAPAPARRQPDAPSRASALASWVTAKLLTPRNAWLVAGGVALIVVNLMIGRGQIMVDVGIRTLMSVAGLGVILLMVKGAAAGWRRFKS
jgi:hypothetical protein